MTELHAPDAMGKAAHDAAMFVSGLDHLLLAASSPSAERQQRADALVRVFAAWPKICRAMSALQAAAPTSAAAGLEDDATLHAWAQDHGSAK